METIFFFVDKDLYIRDLLTSDFIRALGDCFRVLVFMRPTALERNRAYLVEVPTVEYIAWPMLSDRRLNFFKLLRTIFLREFDYLAAQRHKKSRIQRTRLTRVALPIAEVTRSLFTVDFFMRLESRFLARASIERFRDNFTRYQPSLLLTATCGMNNLEAEGILLARRFGLPTVAVDFNWDNLTSKVRNFRRADYLVAWNEFIRNTAREVHRYPDNRITIAGIIRFDPYFQVGKSIPSRESFLRSKGLDPARRTIVFGSTSHQTYPYQRELIRLLLEWRRAGRFVVPMPNIFVRLHYKDSPERYREFLDESGFAFEPHAFTTLDHDIRNLKATMVYGDVHLNYSSTLSLDACALDRPVVSIAFPDEAARQMPNFTFPHYQPLVDIGAVRLARTEDACLNLINQYFEHPELDRAARRQITERYIGLTDGRSYARTVEAVVAIRERLRCNA